MVFFDELQVDVGGGVIGAIEFVTVDAEGLGWRYAIINDSIYSEAMLIAHHPCFQSLTISVKLFQFVTTALALAHLIFSEALHKE